MWLLDLLVAGEHMFVVSLNIEFCGFLLYYKSAKTRTYCYITAAVVCNKMLELNMSSLVLLVSLLAACVPHGMPHIRLCSNSLQTIVMFGQPPC